MNKPKSNTKGDTTELAVSTANKQRGKPFPKGVSGNPKGRPKGSRNKLRESFLSAIAEDWEQHAKQVLEQVRTEQPGVYYVENHGFQHRYYFSCHS